MVRRWLTICLCLGCTLLACSPQEGPTTPAPTRTSAPAQPTPENPALHDDDAAPTGPRLRVTLPSITLLKRTPGQAAQVLLVMADPQGAYSYLLYPANRAGDVIDEFDEQFTVNISATSSSTIGDGQAIGTIIDNDSGGDPIYRHGFE